jgi:urease alpha subunit
VESETFRSSIKEPPRAISRQVEPCTGTRLAIDTMSFDLIIKNGVVATAADVGKYDIGVKDGKIAVLAPSIDPKGSPDARVIDAEGAFVTVTESRTKS